MNNSMIDISWIDQEDEEGVIEKESMDQIQCYYIYISEEEDDVNSLIHKKIRQ